jgi:XTP/dITP diphosphohydrolase
MKEIILATGNKHKVEEISQILQGLPVTVVPMSEFDGIPEIIEDGKTLEENAVKKATIVAKSLKRWTLADDTGLEVDCLQGAPGVYSARYAGPGCTYDDNNRKLLAALKDVPEEKRTARFRCVIALAGPDGKAETVAGEIQGRIADGPKGENGFGYDPIFFVPEYSKTFAELDAETKNRISHRGRALAKARSLIEKMLSSK